MHAICSICSWCPRRLGAVALLSAALACRAEVGAGAGPSSTPPAAESGPPVAAPTTPVLDLARMLTHVERLSSDDLRGRYTFSESLAVAADYIAQQYTAMGIEPVGGSYRVPFDAPKGFVVGDQLAVWIQPEGETSQQIPSKELTTLARGSGRAVFADAVAVPALGKATGKAVRGTVVIAPAPPVDRRNEAITAFAELGAKGLVLVGDDPPPNGEKSRQALEALRLPVAWLSRPEAQEWMGIELSATGAPRLPGPAMVSMAAQREQTDEEAFNVLAVLPGREHPEQIVMLGAHYDHIGTTTEGVMCRPKDGDTICNGADDNASGTAMVLEIARALAEAGYRPARTVVFAHFAAEELGLHGSRALAERPPEAPPFVDGTVVAMINLDMVGRLGAEGLAVGGLSSSDAWMPLLEPVQPDGLTIVYERAINGRSDHANFYRQKIPVLFFFTGLHDDYHQVGDHFDKINREGMALIGQMVADLVQAVADGAAVPYAPPRNDDEGEVSRLPGTREETVEKRVGASGAAGPTNARPTARPTARPEQ